MWNFLRAVASLFSRQSVSGKKSTQPKRTILRFESLEDRIVPTTNPLNAVGSTYLAALVDTNSGLSNAPGSVTIASDNISVVYGQPIPALTYGVSITGGDPNGVDSVSAPTLTTSAILGSPVGTYTITASGATDTAGYSIGYVSSTLTITPIPPLSIQVVNSQSNPIAASTNFEGDTFVNSAPGFVLTGVANGGPGNPVYSAKDLPAGLAIDANTGKITGTILPGASINGDDGVDGIYASTIFVSETDPTGTTTSASATLTWTISTGMSLQVVTALSEGTVGPGQPVTAPTNIEGDTVNLQAVPTLPATMAFVNSVYSETNLPPGLAIDPNTGAITGTISPNAATGGDNGDGIYTMTISFTGTYANGGTTTASTTLNWTVSPRIALSVVDSDGSEDDPSEFVEGIEGVDPQLRAVAVSPDNNPITYSEQGLPTALSINATTGHIEGSIAGGASTGGVNNDGVWTATISATDGTYSASIKFTFNVSSFVAGRNPTTDEADILRNEKRGLENKKVSPFLRKWDFTDPTIKGKKLADYWDFEEREMTSLNMGCVGLCAIRIGANRFKQQGSAVTGVLPQNLPGVLGFLSLDDALAKQKELRQEIVDAGKEWTQSAVLFQMASAKDLSTKLKTIDGKPGQFNPNSATVADAAGYDFGTAFQDKDGNIAYWEHMDNGDSTNPDLVVRRDNSMPYKYHYYFVVVTDAPFRPYTVIKL